ncbi:MAG: OsmC family protein [Proteobacteria bacterium]|nr:OsmC family protein [Pseudomonadota bacterium]
MTQVIAKIGRDKYKTVVITGNHELIGDEPEPFGKDLGPNPYDFLLTALGTCVTMTLRMYADRKGWDLEEVHVHLEQSRVYAKDCEDCESEEGYVHIIEKKLKFIGELTEEQIQRLLEISDRCPVNKTLINEIKINTTILD